MYVYAKLVGKLTIAAKSDHTSVKCFTAAADLYLVSETTQNLRASLERLTVVAILSQT